MSDRDVEFIYVGDPMCSWCWGFAPVLERMDQRYDIPIRTVVGGLRPGSSAQRLDDSLRRTLAHHWHQVEQASGQPFDHAALEREDWVYDTGPSCRAVVTMREVAPEFTLAWFTRLQRAFYAEGKDITDLDVIPSLLDGFDVDRDKFVEVLHDPATAARTQRDFDEARQLGATGFPTLLFREAEEYGIVTRGFLPWETLEPALTRWLEERYGPTADGLVCDVEDGIC